MAVVAASLLALAHSVWFAWRYFQATPWLDMWDWVGEFRAWPEGRFGWHALIAEHNDHRIATARVLFLIDTLFFRMSGRFIATANMVVLVLLGLLLHRVWRSRAIAGTAADLPAIFFIAVMASLCQWENLVTPFQVQFALLLLFSALAAALVVAGTPAREERVFFLERKKQRTFATLHHDKPAPPGAAQKVKSLFASFSSEKEESSFLPWPILAASACYCLAAFSMAGGVLLLPVLLGLLAWRRAPLASALLFAAPCCLAVLVFFHGYAWHSFGVPLRIEGATKLLIAYRMAVVGLEFVGSAFAGLGGGAAIAAGVAGLALLGGAVWRLWRRGRPPADAEAVFLALALFVMANALAAARLRGYFSVWGGVASRYAALSLLFMVSLAGLYVQSAAHKLEATPARAALPALLAILALAAFNLPPSFERDAASLKRALQTAGTTLQQGVYAPTRIGILNPFGLDRVMDNVRFAQRHRLSVFATSGRPPAPIRAMLGRMDPERLPACRGTVNMFYRLDASRAILRAWLAVPDAARTVTWVEVLDAARRPVAVLPAQELREDAGLGPPHAPVMGVFVGFAGRMDDGGLALVGVPDSGTPCRLDVLGPGPARIQAPPDQRPAALPVIGQVRATQTWRQPTAGVPAGLAPLWPAWTHASEGAGPGEADTGTMTVTVAPPQGELGLAVPFATGGSPAGQSLAFSAADGARVVVDVPADTPSGQWRLAALPDDWLARHPGPVTVTARDEGAGARWLAVALPVALRLDPDAARLDHEQPAAGWPVLNLIPPG